MKLTLSHGDVLAGICSFLAGRGLTGFDPNTVHAEFTKGRDGKLTVILDDEAPVAAVAAQKAAEVKETKASAAAADVKETPASEAGASATNGGVNAAAQAEPLSKAAPADQADAVAAEVPANGAVTSEQVASEQATEAATQPAGEENLFG